MKIQEELKSLKNLKQDININYLFFYLNYKQQTLMVGNK
jgi:hypothetical protein